MIDMKQAHADLKTLFTSGPKTQTEIEALERLQTLLESITPTHRFWHSGVGSSRDISVSGNILSEITLSEAEYCQLRESVPGPNLIDFPRPSNLGYTHHDPTEIILGPSEPCNLTEMFDVSHEEALELLRKKKESMEKLLDALQEKTIDPMFYDHFLSQRGSNETKSTKTL